MADIKKEIDKAAKEMGKTAINREEDVKVLREGHPHLEENPDKVYIEIPDGWTGIIFSIDENGRGAAKLVPNEAPPADDMVPRSYVAAMGLLHIFYTSPSLVIEHFHLASQRPDPEDNEGPDIMHSEGEVN